jgi:signal transduction histidine kinase
MPPTQHPTDPIFAMRVRLLDTLLTWFATGAALVGGLFLAQAAHGGYLDGRGWTAVICLQLLVVVRLLRRRLGFRAAGSCFLGLVFTATVLFQARGLSPIVALADVAVLLVAGLLFGTRGTLYAFAACLCGLAVSGTWATRSGMPPWPASLMDPRSRLVWVRYGMVLWFFGGALALAFTRLIARLEATATQLRATLEAERTERTRREAAQRGLERSQRFETLAAFAGGIAHDFNNHLTIIASAADLIRRDPAATSLGVHYADEIAASAQAGSARVRQLLALGRDSEALPEPVSVAASLQHCVPVISRSLAAGIRLQFEAENDGWVFIDAPRLQQALLNVAWNARDAMPAGGTLTLRVSERVVSEPPLGWSATPGRFVVVTCADTGVGLDADTQEHMFEPFFTTKAAAQGSGLGLSLVRAVVDEAHGFIEVDSRPGAGTTFRLFFPLRQRVGADEHDAHQQATMAHS